jgi:hypothetical protein
MRTIRFNSLFCALLAHLSEAKSRITRITILSVVCLFCLQRAYAVQPQEVCDDSTLNGDYASTISGQIFHSDGTVETRQGVVMMHFDGSGYFTQTDYVLDTISGVTSTTPGPVDPHTGFQNHERGNYKVNPDCTGNLTILFAPPPVPGATGAEIKLLYVIGSHGNALRSVVVSVTPPSIVPNTITGVTLHSEGSRVGDLHEGGGEQF